MVNTTHTLHDNRRVLDTRKKHTIYIICTHRLHEQYCYHLCVVRFLFVLGVGSSPFDLMRFLVRLVAVGVFPSRRFTIRGGFLLGSFSRAPHTGIFIGQAEAQRRYLDILNRLLINERARDVFFCAAATIYVRYTNKDEGNAAQSTHMPLPIHQSRRCGGLQRYIRAVKRYKMFCSQTPQQVNLPV